MRPTLLKRSFMSLQKGNFFGRFVFLILGAAQLADTAGLLSEFYPDHLPSANENIQLSYGANMVFFRQLWCHLSSSWPLYSLLFYYHDKSLVGCHGHIFPNCLSAKHCLFMDIFLPGLLSYSLFKSPHIMLIFVMLYSFQRLMETRRLWMEEGKRK